VKRPGLANAAVRGRAGGVHRRRRGLVQPAAAGRLEARPAPGPGRGDGLRGEHGGGRPVLAAGRLLGGRRRPRRRVPARRRVPDAGGGLGPGDPARSAGHGYRGRHRGDMAGRGAPRLPRRAGREAAVEGGPVDAGGGDRAAQAYRHLAGQSAGAGAGQAPSSEHGPAPPAGGRHPRRRREHPARSRASTCRVAPCVVIRSPYRAAVRTTARARRPRPPRL
jgi:hypothetical protein